MTADLTTRCVVCGPEPADPPITECPDDAAHREFVARVLSEHCGGCGFSHPRTTLPAVGPFDDARKALRAMGRRSGFVAVVYTDGDPKFIGAGGCCRDTRELVEREGHGPFGDGCGGTYWAVDKTDAELAADAAAEEHSERLYASAYGLGL